jgi:uncharacterized protein
VHVFKLRRGLKFGAVHGLLRRPALLILGVRAFTCGFPRMATVLNRIPGCSVTRHALRRFPFSVPCGLRTLDDMDMTVEWDPEKAAANLRKHGVSFEEAATVLGDPLTVTLPDPDHSRQEQRYLLLGRSSSGRPLIVSHSDEGERVRIISARVMTPKERRSYERSLEI